MLMGSRVRSAAFTVEPHPTKGGAANDSRTTARQKALSPWRKNLSMLLSISRAIVESRYWVTSRTSITLLASLSSTTVEVVIQLGHIVVLGQRMISRAALEMTF